MGRIIDDQVNIWGKQQGAEIQRSDLWVVNFNQALSGLASVVFSGAPMSPGLGLPYVPPKLATYYASAVALPDLKVRAEPIRRDSRPYQTPSWDEPLDGIRMTFVLDCFKAGGTALSPYRSDIYQMLDVWRAVVRAGRGAMSNEYAITLDGNYRIDYAFDVQLSLLRGSSNPTVNGQTSTPTANQTVAASIINDLEFSTQFRLVNCWLGSFKVSELNYDAAKVVQIDTTFYAEDILQDRRASRGRPINRATA